MIEVQGRQYAIALLDTNILSEMLKDMDRFGTRVLERIDHRRSFVGITTYSVQELRRRKDLFDSLVEVMSWLPTVLLKSGGVLLDDEVRCYATHESMDPILLSPLGIQGADGMSQAEAIPLCQ